MSIKDEFELETDSEKIERLRKRAQKLREELSSLEDTIEVLQQKLVEETIKVPDCDLLFGTWDCPDSPTGKCVYDLNQDHKNPDHDTMGEDECLFCGEPDERK